jgi:glycolate oxidase
VTLPETLVSELAAVCEKAPLTDGFADLIHDESGAGDYAPHVAVYPRNTSEVAAVMRIAHAHGVPVTPRGAGTGKSGGCLPVAGGILLVMTEMAGIERIDSESNFAVVRPGLILADLQKAAAEVQRFYPPDPASAEWCTVGGTVAENAGGPRAFKYGVTRDYVLGLECVLANGEVLRTGRQTSKGVVGYDLTSLLCGSEGSLAVITEVTLELVPAPREIATAFLGFSSVREASLAVTRIIDAGELPACLELLDMEAIDAVRADLTGLASLQTKAAVIVELDGEGGLLERLDRIVSIATPEDAFVAADEVQRRRIWQARKNVSHALKQRYRHKVSEDICVPRARIPEMIERVSAISTPRGFAYATYGHAGDGNLHTNILWNDDGKDVDDVLGRVYSAAVELGGTISGEHGVGLVKREFVSLELSAASMSLQRRVKAAFDPQGILNPHKLFPEERDARRSR